MMLSGRRCRSGWTWSTGQAYCQVGRGGCLVCSSKVFNAASDAVAVSSAAEEAGPGQQGGHTARWDTPAAWCAAAGLQMLLVTLWWKAALQRRLD